MNNRIVGLRFLIIFLIAINSYTFSQVTETFSDGNFNTNPAWFGDTTKFIVSNTMLKLNAPYANGTAYLYTESKAINNASWEFLVKFNFNPSSSNYAKFFLISEQTSFNTSLNGYFIKIGDTYDDISLYKQTANTTTRIINGNDGRLNRDSVLVRIKVTRDSIGNWQLFSDTTGGTNYILEGESFDNTYFTTQYIALFCCYTSTRCDKFYFDDIFVTGFPYIDSIPPKILKINSGDSASINIYFNEKIKISSALAFSNYYVSNTIGNPTIINTDTASQASVTLFFNKPFKHGIKYQINITGIYDINDNLIHDTIINFIYNNKQMVNYRDVVINEIMADPSPPQSLPDIEYIEIFNTTQNYILLNGWQFSDGYSTATFDSIYIEPNEYILVCKNDYVSVFNKTGKILGVSVFPSLNNTGDNLFLKTKSGKLIDQVSYTDNWYCNEEKKLGGFSLEQINPYFPCSNANNWTACNSLQGGTPARVNSVFDSTPDIFPPVLINVNTIDSNSLLLNFNEPIDSLTLQINAISISSNLTPVALISTNSTQNYILKFAGTLQVNTIYTLSITGVSDCWGNTSSLMHTNFIYPEQAKFNDIVINEILFNPFPGGVDFVEIFNKSTKYISLKNWYLASFDIKNNSIKDSSLIITTPFIISPQQYIVLTTDTQNILTTYPQLCKGTFLQLKKIPTYSDKYGTVVLLDNKRNYIDYVDYTEDMHFPLIAAEGVSLERINPNRPSNEKSNWMSAAGHLKATPNCSNSQSNTSENSNDILSLIPEIFSPDNDGYNDFITISYSLLQAGYVGTITIFDASGVPVRNLVNNELLGTSGNYIWNGITNYNEKARTGMYIVFFEIFDLDGKTKHYKKVCVLASR